VYFEMKIFFNFIGNFKRILAVQLILTSFVYSQNRNVIKLNDCIKAAIVNYPSLSSSRKLIESKVAKLKSIQSRILPQLDFISHGEYDAFNSYGFGIFDNRIQLSWNSGDLFGKLERTGITEEKIARINALKIKLDLIYRVKMSFYQFAVAGEKLKALRLSEKLLERQREINKKLYKLGQIKLTDYYFTQTSLSRAKELILKEETEVENYRIQLESLTGLNIGKKDSLTFNIKFSVFKHSFDSLFSRAKQFNPALAILNNQIKLAEINANLINAGKLPTIYLQGGYVLNNDPTSGGNYSVISGGLRVPLADWGKRKYRATEFKLKAASIKFARLTLLKEIKVRLKKLVNEFLTTEKLIKLKEATISEAIKTYKLTLINYKAGIASNTDALIAHKAWLFLRISREKLILKLFNIQSEIEYLIGKTE